MLKEYRLLLKIMTEAERRRFWFLVAITFLLSLLEAGSVVSILPFLRLLSDPTLVDTDPWMAWVYEIGGFDTVTPFLFWLGFGVLGIIISGLGLRMLMIWLTTRFALMRSFSISSKLFSSYLYQPYEWFLDRRSSDLENLILSEVDKVVSEGLLPAMRLIPDFFSVVLLLLALFLLEPEIAIGGGLVLGGTYLLVFFSVRHIMIRVGRDRLESNIARFHSVQESVGGLKELKVMGLERLYLDRFREAALRMARAQTLGQVIMNVPRQAIEMVAFAGLISLILLLIRSDVNALSTLLPTLGLIASVGMRLIPRMQQVYFQGSSIRQVRASLERIYSDLRDLQHVGKLVEQTASRNRLHVSSSLELKEVSYSYPNTSRPTLTNINLRIEANQTIGIVGGTGAGKTTLVDIILGLIVPSQGYLLVDGSVITAENVQLWQSSVGYVPQTIFLSDSTIAENIAFGRSRDDIDMEAVERAARGAAIHDFVVRELPKGYATLVGERGVRLSGGQRQRIGLARALYNDPDVLVFDEATSALDNVTEAAVMEAIRSISGSKTLIMIAHRLSTVRACDQIVFMKSGQILDCGTFPELIKRSEYFRELAN